MFLYKSTEQNIKDQTRKWFLMYYDCICPASKLLFKIGVLNSNPGTDEEKNSEMKLLDKNSEHIDLIMNM